MKLNSFQKTAIITVIATLFLIFVGGVVRSTGSGMGCPDWPKCFGSWVPPTSVSELPKNYKEVFVGQRLEKNKKIVTYLEALGANELAHRIENDPNIKREESFNPLKTWIEYINRLVGATIGILVFLTFLLSLRYWKENKKIPILSLLTVLLTGFQGWLGSIVVSTNLLPGIITVHMILAMVIVTALLYAAFSATKDFVKFDVKPKLRKQLSGIVVTLFVLSIIQMILGTEVREEIDAIKAIGASPVPDRSNWIAMLGFVFEIHRTFSWLLVFASFYLGLMMYRNKLTGQLKKIGWVNVFLVFAQVFIGIGLAYLSVPRFLQVLHLTGIAIMICTQFLMILMLRSRTE